MADRRIKNALIAVYDKTGVADFARALVDEFRIEIISTGGTAKHLREAGIPVTMVEQVTGFPELLDGRVKTLHPKIHAGILADRDNPEHMRQLAEHGIQPIDMVVVNLYPFEKTIADPNCKFEEAIEMIDIGGPCMLRAAAKNHRHVLVICNGPASYDGVLGRLRMPERPDLMDELYSSGALAVYDSTAGYDAAIATWLSANSTRKERHDIRYLRMFGCGELRYGENPHQAAELLGVRQSREGLDLTIADAGIPGEVAAQKSISFNNYVDAHAALGLCAELARALKETKLWYRLLAGASANRPKTQLLPIDNQIMTRRNLPHIQRPGATYFVTFRVKSGKLSEDERTEVLECCLHPDGTKACLHAAVVMPDHVHLMFSPLEAAPGSFHQLGAILQGIKGVSARRVNSLRGAQGSLWQDETWDRIMRSEQEYMETLAYICANPMTAGLPDAADYTWCVHEREPGWDATYNCAGVDLEHVLVWHANSIVVNPHRLIAGATSGAGAPNEKSTTIDKQAHRLIAGATGGAGTTHAPLLTCVFIKHTNACGVGIAETPAEAYRLAYLGDPNAAMGGILAVNFNVDAEFAAGVMETYDRLGKAAGAGGFFVEVWVAPTFDEKAIEIIRSRKKWGENARLLAVGDLSIAPDAGETDYRRISGGVLVQTLDLLGLNEDQWKVVTRRQPNESEMSDLRLAWLIAKHTKSNAISLCKDGMLIGNGAGQMSRVMSCRIATWLAKENGHADKLPGSAAASDAFFPFRDGPDILMDAGVTAIIQPGGSKRDEDTIKACDERDVAMIFTGTRHFRH